LRKLQPVNDPIKCFLIDDDPDDQEIFSIALKELSPAIQCFFANDGVEALERLNTGKSFIPDYIFIDLNMPRMNGAQCLAAIKKIGRVKSTPVFIYSTTAEPGMITETQRLGATGFIVKPVYIADLTTILRQHLQPALNRGRQTHE
jgi:CheY-like chemotaxis protein